MPEKRFSRRWTKAAVPAAVALLVLANASAAMAAGAGKDNGRARSIDVRVGSYNVCGHGCLPTKEECERVIGRDCATKLKPWADGRAAAVAEDVDAAGLGVVATQEIGNNPT
jgi:hypothetical protein